MSDGGVQHEGAQAPWGKLALGLTTLFVLALTFDLVNGGWEARRIPEHGALEWLSFIGYLVAAFVFAHVADDARLARFWHLPGILYLMAMREMDLDKAFTDPGLLKSRLYTGDAPLAIKLVGMTVIALILWFGVRLLRHGWRPLLQAIRARRAWPALVLCAGLAVVVTNSVDGLARKLAPFGIEVSDAVAGAAEIFEEAGEAAIPLTLILAIWTARQRR